MNPFILLALLSAVPPLTADVQAAPAPLMRRLTLTAGYLGEQLFHPGGQLGVEYTLGRFSALSLVATGNLGGFVHYRYATGLYADAGVGARVTAHSGFLVELLGDIGYLHLIPNGAVYKVPDQGGAPQQIANLGRPAFRFGGTLGLGVDLSHTPLKVPLALTLRLGVFGETQFSEGVLLHPHALVCVSWSPW
jgi:hypothetical protein